MSRIAKHSTANAAQAADLTEPFLNPEVLERGADWRDLASIFPCVFYECSADFTVLAVSANSAELLGIARDRVLGNAALWNERLLIEDRRRLLSRLDERGAPGAVSEVHRLIDDRGLPVWVSHSVRKTCAGASGKILGCMIPLPRDLNEAGFHQNAVPQFVHKIGNHFQLINLLIGSLRRTAKAPDEIESLQQTVDRAAELTRTFLHYSQVPSAMTDVDLGEVLRSVFYLYVPRFDEKKVKFEDLVEDSLDGTLVRGDPFSLELAFGAVLRNALDATGDGDLVTVTGKHPKTCAAGNSVARISVVDTGRGMEPQFLDKAAIPFYSTKPERDGLGLSLAMRVIDGHGGLLSISSSAGRGTGVDIVLPVHGAASRLDP